ncbi:MAG: YhdP family phospholipid transporter [Gammaproteobacteria bacterium]
MPQIPHQILQKLGYWVPRLLAAGSIAFLATVLVLTYSSNWMLKDFLRYPEKYLPDNIEFSHKGSTDYQTGHFRHLYHIENLRISDRNGAWELYIPALDLEVDFISSLLRRKLYIQSLLLSNRSIQEPAFLLIKPWLISPKAPSQPLLEVLKQVENVTNTISKFSHIDIIVLEQFHLQLARQNRQESISYIAEGKLAANSSTPSGRLTLRGSRPELGHAELIWNGLQRQGWRAQLTVRDADLAFLVQNNSLKTLQFETQLQLQGKANLVPSTIQGSLNLSSIESDGIPWGLKLEIPSILFIRQGQIGEPEAMRLYIDRISTYIDQELLELESLTLGMDATAQRLFMAVEKQEIKLISDLVTSLVPLPEDIHDNLIELNPQGELRNLLIELPLDAPQQFQLSGYLSSMRTSPTTNSWPGLLGIEGPFIANIEGGSMHANNLASITLDLPQFFDPMRLSHTTGLLNWKIEPHAVWIQLKDFDTELAGGTLSGQLAITLPTLPQTGATRLEASISGSALNAADAWRYTPKLPHLLPLIEYLKTSIQGGTGNQMRTLVRVGLDKGEGFSMHLHTLLNNGQVQYAPDWPTLEKANGSIEIWGDRVQVLGESGQVSQLNIDSAQVQVAPSKEHPDWLAIELSGNYDGQLANGIDFLLNSSISEAIEPALGTALSEGAIRGRLTLGRILLPPASTDAEIEFYTRLYVDFLKTKIHWPEWDFTADQVTGRLLVDTQQNFSSQNLQARVLDHQLDLWATGVGPLGEEHSFSMLHFDGGRINADQLYAYIEQWNQFLQGSTEYRGKLTIPYSLDQQANLYIHTNLVGMETQGVPNHFSKSTEAVQDFEMTLFFPPTEQEPLQLQVESSLFCANLHYIQNSSTLGGELWLNESQLCRQTWSQDRVFKPLDISGWVDEVDVAEQIDFFERLPFEEGSENSVGLTQIRLNRAQLAGQTFHNMQVLALTTPISNAVYQRLTPSIYNRIPDLHTPPFQQPGMLISFTGDQTTGYTYVPDAEELPVDLHLRQLHLDFSETPETDSTSEFDDPTNIPLTHIHIDELWLGKTQLGGWNMQLQPRENELNITFQAHPDNPFQATAHPLSLNPHPYAVWQFQPEPATRIQATFSYDGSRQANTIQHIISGQSFIQQLRHAHVDLDLGWPGPLNDPDMKSISGTASALIDDIHIDLSTSQIASTLLNTLSLIHPGNLFSVLTSFNLKKASGSWFREVIFETTIGNQNLTIPNFVALGSASSIYGRGTINLDQPLTHSDMNMDLQIYLPVAKSLPWYLAILEGLTAGASLYILNFLLGSPLDRAVAISANLTGTLENPEIRLLSEPSPYQRTQIWLEDKTRPYSGSVEKHYSEHLTSQPK